MKITIDQIIAMNPCGIYDDPEYLRELSGGRDELTISEFANLENVSIKGKLWVLLRLVSEKQLHLLMCDIVEHVLPIYEKCQLEDKRSRAAIDTKRKWVHGRATDEERDAASKAALVTFITRATQATLTNNINGYSIAPWIATDAACVASGAKNKSKDAHVAMATELQWQLNKTIEYLESS